MTTSRSPVWYLKAQAETIARRLKASVPAPAACTVDKVTFGVAMDDKLISIELPWQTVHELSQAGLAQFILYQMRKEV